MSGGFYLSTLVDFPDDASVAVFRESNIEAMIETIARMGIRRVYWIYYGDESYGFFWRKGIRTWEKLAETIGHTGEPLAVAARAARKHGLEIYAVIKPYENGVAMVYPEGTAIAKEQGLLPHIGGSLPAMMTFVHENPHMRIKRRTDDIPANLDGMPIGTIKLYKSDAGPTRIRKENIRIWTSEDNVLYELRDADFEFGDAIEEAPEDFHDLQGDLLASRSSPVRALTLSGLHLTDKYVAVSTDFADGSGTPDFHNAALHMVRAFSDRDEPMPISMGIRHRIYSGEIYEEPFDFRRSGIVFDDGWGEKAIFLDQPDGGTGQEGFIALTRGRGEYLPTALCESYPEVRQFWLRMVRECLDAGVDGIDFRIENHSTHTNDPFSYGYNDVVLEAYRRRHPETSDSGPWDPAVIAEIRGECYTDFLRQAKRLISERGAKMQIHLNEEFAKEVPQRSRYLAFPWNIRFDWERWLEEGIMDEATLRTFDLEPQTVLADDLAQRVIAACNRFAVPLHYNRYIYYQSAEQFGEELELIRGDGRFESLIVYEAASYLTADEELGVRIVKEPFVEVIQDKARQWASAGETQADKG